MSAEVEDIAFVAAKWGSFNELLSAVRAMIAM